MNQLALTSLICLGTMAIAYWKESAVPFMVAGAVGIATSLYWYDTFTNTFGLAVSLPVFALSLYFLVTAFRAMFAKRGDDEED